MSSKTQAAWIGDFAGDTSLERARQKFGSVRAALEYPAGYPEGLKPRLERASVLKMLRLFPKGSHILDLPCGTGRVMQLLLEQGFRVTAADCSEFMVDQCHDNMLAINPKWETSSEFLVRDAVHTGFENRSFDGVMCNRLLHHLVEPESRIEILRELAKISRGPVVASFSNCFALGVWWKRLRKLRSLRRKSDERPIPLSRIKSEFESAGMSVIKTSAVLWGLSRMWYVAGIPK